MTTIRFMGFAHDKEVTISAAQQGLMRGPATVSAWKASNPIAPGTFRTRVSITDETWTDVQDGEIIESVSGRVRVWVDNFAGWVDDDPRNIYVETDMGERYDMRYADHADLPVPNTLRRLAGTTLGVYPGVLCGHAMRGTDMAGNQVLTATHDQGNGAPIGTLDQTVTVFVADGAATSTLTFTLRLIHPEAYFADRAKSVFTGGAETERLGTVYVSRDGDFSQALPAQSPTPQSGGVFHVTLANGEFNTYDMRAWAGVNWSNATSAARVLFKAGETFYPVKDGNAVLDPNQLGPNGQMGTWFHTGTNGDVNATLAMDRMANHDPTANHWLLRSNGTNYSGARIADLTLKCSDYDVSDITWREWWNELKYTASVGTVAANTSTNMSNGYNGEILRNADSSVFTQVIYDDGVDTLICRQVVDMSNVDDAAAAQAFFADGAVLTGVTSGATRTFTTTGSRQDRTQKIPATGAELSSLKCLLFDNIQVIGANSAIGGLGTGAVLSDSLVSNYWNYGVTQTSGDPSSWSETGVVVTQPLSYEGTSRSFGGASVSGNRNYFNAMITSNTLATNDVSHSARRLAYVKEYSQHYCFGSTYGGHGGGHQPAQRMGTGGTTVENDMTVQYFGCGHSGGNNQIHFGLAGAGTTPMTPTVIRIENCHLRANHSSIGTNFFSVFTNYALRNCLLDQPNGVGWSDETIGWIAMSSNAYSPDPDANAVDPIVEFCTFTALLDTSPASTVVAPAPAIRSTPITYRNNAFVLDSDALGSIDAGVLAMSDDLADFTADLRPTSSATQAYQSGSANPTARDALGGVRPTTGFSKGAFEA